MLLTPLDQPFLWHTPPRFALGLALALTLIFLTWHIADVKRQQALTQQYQQELLAIEWPLYETHALKSGQRRSLDTLKVAYSRGNNTALAAVIGNDAAFVQGLHDNGKDYLSPAAFTAWQQARQHYDEKRAKLGANALGLNPHHFRVITFLTFSLIQPDLIQFLSALLLLLTAGIALELSLGGGVVLASWLSGSVVGALSYLISNGGGVLPLVGAGAGIAGIMGLFLLQFRHHALLYFGKFPLTALIILLLWVATVLTQFFLSPLRIPELFAQLGGFSAGLICYGVQQRWFAAITDNEPIVSTATTDDTNHEQLYREQLQLALNAVANLDFNEAQRKLRELIKAHPQDLRSLTQLYHIEKLKPDSDIYDAVTRRLFTINSNDDHALSLLLIYRDYDKLSLHKRALDTETSLRLIMRFARIGEVKDAEKLIKPLLERKVSHALLGKAAITLSQAFEQLQDHSRAEFYREIAH